MAESRDCGEDFLEGSSGVGSPGAVMEAGTSQTQQQQMMVVFPAAAEQRGQNTKMTQTEQAWIIQKAKQSVDEQHTEIKTKSEALKIQRQLTRELMEEIEELWRETESERSEIKLLKIKTEQQQKDIERLASEKHIQHLKMKQLNLQIENMIEKFERNKFAAKQEKTQLQNMWAEIYQERETLDRRHNDIIYERLKLEMIKYGQTKSEKSEEPKDATEQIKRELDMMESICDKNKEMILAAKREKEKAENFIAQILQEFERNKKDISQQCNQIKHFHQILNVKVKQRWANIQREADMQKAVEVETRDRHNEGKAKFDSLKLKLCSVQEEMEKLWNVLGESERRQEAERQKQELDDKLQCTKTEIREMEVLRSEIEIKKKELVKMMRMNKREKEEISKIKEDIEKSKQDMKSSGQVLEKVEDRCDEAMFEEGDTVSEARESQAPQQRRMDFSREKTQIKWMKFQTKKRKRELDHQLEKILKERDEVEIMKIKIQQQRDGIEQTRECVIHAIRTMTEIKTNLKQTAAVMNNTQREILEAQRRTGKDKEDVEKYMDKLTSMKAQVSGWTEIESAVQKTFSVDTCKPQKETLMDFLTYQTRTISTGKGEAEDKITKQTTSLSDSTTLENEHQEQQNNRTVIAVDIKEEKNISLHMQTEIHGTFAEEENTDLLTNVIEIKEVEEELFRLKAQEQEIKDQIKHALEDVKEQGWEIKRLIKEIKDLERQSPEVEFPIREPEHLDEQHTELKDKTEQGNILTTNAEVSLQKIMQYEVCELMNLDDKKQKQAPESGEKPQKHGEQTDGGYEEKLIGSADIQRLRKEIYQTQDIIRLIKDENEKQAGANDVDAVEKPVDGCIEGLLKDIKMFQKFLKMLRTVLKQNDEMSNIKSMKIALKRKRRELDQRLEKILREKDELEILKIKMVRQAEITQQQVEKLAKMRWTLEKMTATARNKSEELESIKKKTEANLRQIWDLHSICETAKQDMKSNSILTSRYRATFEKIKTEIREKRDQESGLDSAERNQEDLKNQTAMDFLKDVIEQKQEFDDRVQRAKREIREMELLKSELDIKKKQSEQMFRKSRRKREESEILWDKLEQEKESFRRETKKKRRELDQRLEKTMRERDELELLKIKLKQQQEELAMEKQRRIDWDRLIYINRECEEQSLEKKYGKLFRKETEQQNLNVMDFLSDLQNMKEKIHVNIETFRREIGVLEQVNVHLQEQREVLNVIKSELKNAKENVANFKTHIKMNYENTAMQVKAEMDEMVHIREDIKNQQEELDLKIAMVKRERQEMEVLMSELEIKKRENQQLTRKSIRKEQGVKKVCAAVKEERDALKRETKKRKKEIDQRMERITRQRDELEIMQIKLQRQKDKGNNEKAGLHIIEGSNQIKNWELIQILTEKYKQMKTDNEFILKTIQGEKQQIKNQEKIITCQNEEVINMRMELKKQKEIMICAFKNMQHQQKVEINIKKELRENEQKSQKQDTETMNNKTKEGELEVMTQTAITEQEELEGTISIIKGIKEEKKQMKTNVDNEKEMLLHERKVIQEERPELKESEVELMEKPKAIEALRIKITHLTERLSEQNKLKMERLEENIDLQNMCSVLEKQLTIIERKKEDMSCYSEMLQREKGGLRTLLSDIVNQKEPSERKVKEKTEMEKQVLQRQKEEIEKERKELTLQIEIEKERLKDAMDMLNFKTKEQEVKENELEKEKQEMQIINKKVDVERDQLENIRQNLSTKQEELEAAMSIIKAEQEQVSQMKAEVNNDIQMLLHEKKLVQEERSELKDTEDQLMEKAKAINALRFKITKLAERLSEEIKPKMERIEESIDLPNMCSVFKEQLTMIEQKKEDMSFYSEMLQREKEGLGTLLSDIVNQKEPSERKLKEETEMEKQMFDKQKAELEKERKDLRLQGKTESERLKDVMDMLTLEQNVQQLRENELGEKMQNLQILREKVEKERDQLEITRKNLSAKEEEQQATMNIINGEREQVSQMKTEVDNERQMLLNERKVMKEERSKVKETKDQHLKQGKAIEALRFKITNLTERLREEIKPKIERLEENIDLQNMCSLVEEKLTVLAKKEEEMGCYIQMIQSEIEGLRTLVCGIANKIKDTAKKFNEAIEMENQVLQSQKEKKERERTEMTLQIEIEKERLKDAMDMLNFKKKEQELKENELEKEMQEILNINKKVSVERDQLENLRQNLSTKQEEMEAAMSIIKAEREQVSQMKAEVNNDRQMLLHERKLVQEERSELKETKDQLMDKEKAINSLRFKMTQLTERLRKRLNPKWRD
ncbi:uncharacterized protein KZ484_005720 isoform 1-T2 [Pholidichthys leucotaenia]